MTTYIGVGKANTVIKSGLLRTVTFTGTVKVDGVGAIRKIIGIKTNFPLILYETSSDSSGDWTLDIPGGTNDFFRIICVGETGENSEIYEHLVG